MEERKKYKKKLKKKLKIKKRGGRRKIRVEDVGREVGQLVQMKNREINSVMRTFCMVGVRFCTFGFVSGTKPLYLFCFSSLFKYPRYYMILYLFIYLT